MYQYFTHEGPAVTAGALMLTGAFSGEMEPIDRVFEEDTPGVWTAGGSVFFKFNGREYSQDFCAAAEAAKADALAFLKECIKEGEA